MRAHVGQSLVLHRRWMQMARNRERKTVEIVLEINRNPILLEELDIRFSRQLNVSGLVRRRQRYEYRVLNNFAYWNAAAVPKDRCDLSPSHVAYIAWYVRRKKVDGRASVTSLNILNTLRALIKLRELVVALDCSGWKNGSVSAGCAVQAVAAGWGREWERRIEDGYRWRSRRRRWRRW